MRRNGETGEKNSEREWKKEEKISPRRCKILGKGLADAWNAETRDGWVGGLGFSVL